MPRRVAELEGTGRGFLVRTLSWPLCIQISYHLRSLLEVKRIDIAIRRA